MSTNRKSEPTTVSTAAPSATMSNWTVDDIRKSDILTFRESRSEYVDTVVCPNGLQVGLLDEAFVNDLLVVGNITGSGVIYASTAFSGSLQTLVDGSNYLRGANGISITNHAEGYITITGGGATQGTTYTAGQGMTLSNSNVFTADPDLTTIGFDSNDKLTTLKVPNTLTIGSGLSGTNFDGSANSTISVSAVSGSPIIVTNGGVDFSTTNVSAVSVAANDHVLVTSANGVAKVQVQDLINLGIGNTNLIPQSAEYLVMSNHSGLSNEKVFSADNGLQLSNTSSGVTVSALVKTNAGLEIINGELAVKVGDFVGTGLTANSNTGRIDLNLGNIAGAGLTQNGSVLDVEFGTSVNQVAKGSNTVGVNAGKGLIHGNPVAIGNTSSMINLAVDASDIAGLGTQISNGNIDINLTGQNGITIGSGANNSLLVGFNNEAGYLTSVVAGAGLLDGGTTNNAMTVNIDYLGNDSLIKSATDGTGITVDVDNDLLLIQDHSDNGTVKYIKPSQLGSGGSGGSSSGTIGAAEDGTYTDGLFTDFTDTTPVGTAVDRFNEIFKFLVPKTAPVLSSIDLDTDTGVTGILSFGTSNTISGISNVLALEDQPAIDVNGSYTAQTSSGGHTRAGIYGTAIELVGDLASAVPVDLTGNGNTNYPIKAFGKGNLGSLILEINGSDVKTIDLTSGTVGAGVAGSGSGSELTSGTGFFELSAATGGKYNSGDPYDLEKHRTGKWKIAAAAQRGGWNYMRVKHVIGSTTYTTTYIQWIVDSVTSNGQINLGTPTLSSLALAGSKHLSGVEYYTGGTATYAVSVGNFYTNVYATSNITLDSSEIATVIVTPSSINTGGGEDESKAIAISETVTIDATTILNSPLNVSISATHPTKNAISSQGTASLANLLVYNIAEASSTVLKTTESMDGESFRLESGTYATQSAVASGTFDSTVSLVTNGGLQVWNRKLVAPIRSTNGGDYSDISNGPSGNPDYSGLTTGTKTYFRKFTNTKGGSSSNFTLEIDGVGTIVDNTTSLTGDKLQIFMKVPGSGTNVTGWMDLSSSFATGAYGDNDGCYVEAFDSSINSSILFTSGIKFVENNDHIVIKIVADGSWTGHVDELRFTWR